MAGNTYASTGQRTSAAAMPAMPSTGSKYKSMGQPRAYAVTKAPGISKGGVSQFPRPARFGAVGKSTLGIVNTATFKAGG